MFAQPLAHIKERKMEHDSLCKPLHRWQHESPKQPCTHITLRRPPRNEDVELEVFFTLVFLC